MFYPQAMSEVELIVPAKDALAVTRVLAGQGILHQVDANYLSAEAEPGADDAWQGKAAGYAALERRLLATMQTLDVEEGTPPPADRVSMIEIEMVRPLVTQAEQEVQKASEQLTRAQKRLERLESYLRQLEPLAGIDLDIGELRNPGYIFSMLGTIPLPNLARLQTSLARTPFVLLTLRQEERTAVVWLAGSKRDADILGRAARSAYLNPLNLPPIHKGTPAEVIQSLHTAIDREKQRVAEQRASLSQLHEMRKQQLHLLLWRVRASRMLAEALVHYGRLHHTYLVIGWVPTAGLDDLTQRLKQASSQILIDTRTAKRGSAEQNVPVSFPHHGLLGAFQELVTMYARPRYDELDPTILLALTFPLLFGAMFGDVGHGLELALLGLLLNSRKIKALNSLAGLGQLIAICGAVAMVFGFLYGSVFGVETLLTPLWIRPIDNIMQILYVSVGAGIVLLSVGFLLNMFNAATGRDWGRLFFDRNGVAGFLLYWSLLGLVAASLVNGFPIHAAVFIIPTIVSFVVVMFSEVFKHLVEKHRPLVEGGLGTYGIQVFFEMFDTLISFLSNSLSYVRVGAFAVAHAGLSSVFFILARLVSPGHSVGYWIVVVIGNIFIIGFEGLIVGIQTMRLEYYEFFNKFFTGGGLRYKPLTVLPVAEE